MASKKIALLGASSATGVEFILQNSQNQEVEIYAFVRSPQKLNKVLPSIPSNLRIITFDINQEGDWKKLISECEVWVSIVGISGLMKARKPNNLYSNTAQLLLALSKLHKPSRVLIVTSGGVIESPGEPWILKYFLKPLFLNPMYADMREMERIVKDSELPFTIVRPPYLTKGKLQGKYRIIVNDWFKDDKVLSRKDLAHFLISESITPQAKYHRAFVGISY